MISLVSASRRKLRQGQQLSAAVKREPGKSIFSVRIYGERRVAGEMNIEIPVSTSLWEAVATIQILQARGNGDRVRATGDVEKLLSCAGIHVTPSRGEEFQTFRYAEAYRAIDTSQEPYCGVLATVNDLIGLKISAPDFPGVTASNSGGIVICPFAPKPEVALPAIVWRAIIRYLRGFGKPMHLIGNGGQWQDECGYSEDEILSERSVPEKLAMIAGAELIVGLPNEWMWAATAWQKRLVYFYPNDVPPMRWWHWAGERYGRAVYRADQLQVPVILHQLKGLIEAI